MPSNLDFNAELLAKAQKLGGFRYKKDAINAALEEFIRKREQIKIKECFSAIEYDPNYDYKEMRN